MYHKDEFYITDPFYFKGKLYKTNHLYQLSKKGKIPFSVKKVIVKDIPPDQFPMEYMKHISEEQQNTVRKYVYLNTGWHNVTKTGIEVNKHVNQIYIYKQLGLPTPETDKNEIFYFIRDNLGGILDVSYTDKSKERGGIASGKTDVYLKKLHNTMFFEDPIKYPTWEFVQDYLNITSKEAVEVYDKNMKVSLLNYDTIMEISKTPFFLIICEKQSTLKAFMRELIIRGYGKKYDYYGINLGGQSTSYVVKLLSKLSQIRNFYAFCLHDLDVSGVEILLDMKKQFNVISIGVNPEFLEYIGVNFDDLKELWRPRPRKKKTGEIITEEELIQETRDSLIKKAQTVLNKIDISEEQYKIYNDWIEYCSLERAELNSLTAYRLKEDIYKSKVRDFVNYFEKLMKDCKWNLLRVRDFKKKDTFTYSESEHGEKIEHGEIIKYHTFGLSKTVSYDVKTELNRLSTYEYPDFINDTYNDKKESIKTINEELDDVRSEITNLMRANIRKIIDEFNKMRDNEYNELIKRKQDLLHEFEEDNPELFDINWEELFDKKKLDKFNKRIGIEEKLILYNNTKKYKILREELMDYIGSIENPTQPIFKNMLKLFKFIGKTKEKGDKRVERLKKIISKLFERTEEYKEAKEIVDEFEEFEDDIEKKFDKELAILEEIKEIREKMSKKIDKKLEKYKKIKKVDKK